MTASQFSALFVAALLSNAVIKLWLAYRQLDHVAANRAEVPLAFREQINIAAHHKAADYTSTLVRFGTLTIIFDTVLLLAFTVGGGIQWLSDASSSLTDSLLLQGVA
ncbi:MAG: M48 family peptidase, partial [Sideroxydans sp.]